ncbi:hypothetical protein [Natronohydrobacter thiooxidans]|uniref:hypothetical protein n=1 Tax=Natronohydrobacter thiooxidans TaxID=87172 RepID=UPI0008FF4C8F|nr:hypothetical protein [Natronohydrobacter thiooxidans]
MRHAASILAFGSFLSLPAAALELPDCVSRPNDASSCSPVVACMPGDGVYLVGRAIGWNEGALEGVTNTGLSCSGTWRIGQSLRLGHAEFSCDDGLAGQMIYYYQDSATGTARGTGLISGFGRIRAWSGHNIRQFLDQSGARVEGEVMCGETPMLLS